VGKRTGWGFNHSKNLLERDRFAKARRKFHSLSRLLKIQEAQKPSRWGGFNISEGSKLQAANDNERLPIRRTNNRAALCEIRPIPRRGLSRAEAAMYVGISTTKFDQLVHDGRMPYPICLDSRKIWDIRKLDGAFDALDAEPIDQSWDDFENSAVKAA
jgi:hypothetical protein